MMKKLKTKNWNLCYLEGWEMANLKLTNFFNAEIIKLNLPEDLTNTESLQAAQTIWSNMKEHFSKPYFMAYDAISSDVDTALTEALCEVFGVYISSITMNTQQN